MTEVNDLLGLLDHIKKDFIDEFPSRIENIEQLTLNCEKNNTFHEIYHNVHSLKGNGGTLGLPVITSICHQYESFLNQYAHGHIDNDFIQRSLKYIDLLKDVSSVLNDSDTNDFKNVEEKLNNIHEDDIKKKKAVLVSVISPLDISILKESLPEDRYFITLAKSGMDALEHLMLSRYDLLITSLETSLLNGIALISAIKNNGGKNKEIKSILLTSKKIEPDQANIPSIIINKDTHLNSNLEKFLDTL